MPVNSMDYLLHGITLFSVVIATIGFLFLSYDILDRPHGILRWLIQVIVPGLVFALPFSIIAFFIPESWMLGPFSVKTIATYFAVYGGLIGFFNGLFADSPNTPSSQRSNHILDSTTFEQLKLPFKGNDAPEDLAMLVSQEKFLLQQPTLYSGNKSDVLNVMKTWWKPLSRLWNMFLRDGLVGFLLASTFWFVETFLILGYPFYDFTFDYLMREYIGFALVGFVGGSLWRFIHQPLRQSMKEPLYFSLSYCLVGLVLWTIIFMMISLIIMPVYSITWHQGFVAPQTTLLAVTFFVLVGGIIVGFIKFFSVRLNSLPTIPSFKRNIHASSLIGKGTTSLKQETPRITSNPSSRATVFAPKRTLLELVFWFIIWLITGLGILLIAVPVLTILTNIVYPIDNTFDPQAAANLMSQHFLLTVIIGTAITVLLGSFAFLVLQYIFQQISKSDSGSIRDVFSVSSPKVFKSSSANSSGHLSMSLISRTFSLLMDGFIRLASWYEIWFVFAIVLITYIIFNNYWEIPVIVFVGTAITVLGGGLLRILGRRAKNKQYSRNNQSSIISFRNSLMKLVFWPFLWLAIWIVVITTFLSEDWSSFETVPQTAQNVLRGMFYKEADRIILIKMISVEEHRFILIGTAITMLAGGIVFLLLRFLFWWGNRLHSSFAGKYSFQNLLRRGPRGSIHTLILQTLENNPDKPFFFSLGEGLLRLVFWTGTWFMCGVFVFVGFSLADNIIHAYPNPVVGFDINFLFYGLLGTLAIALAGVLTGGFSNSILQWATNLPQKRLAVFGVILTVFGFSLQLIEPTVLLAYRPPPHGHTDAVLAVEWSPDGKHIATASADQTVQVWTIGLEGNVLAYRGHRSSVKTLSWSPNGEYIVSGSEDGAIQLWDAFTGRTVSNSGVPSGYLSVVAWSPLGNLIASSSDKGAVLIWDTTKKDGTNIVVDFREAIPLDQQDPRAKVTDLAWSPNGQFIAATYDDGVVIVWNISEGVFDSTEIFLSPKQSNPLLGVTWAMDNQRIAVAGGDKTVQVWNIVTKKKDFTYTYNSAVNAVAWSPDGKRIAFASADSTVGIVDLTVKGNKLVVIYRGHFDKVNALTWSPDGTRIASASDDKTVQIWDATSGEKIYTFSSSGSP